MLEAVILIVFPFCMLFAAVSDMLSMTIANRVSIVLVATFLIVAPLTGMDWQTFGWHLAAGAIVLSITLGLFALGGMGGGDAKLLAATSVWMGFGFDLIAYLLAASFIGGLLTLSVLLYRVLRCKFTPAAIGSCAILPRTPKVFPMALRLVLPACWSIRRRH